MTETLPIRLLAALVSRAWVDRHYFNPGVKGRVAVWRSLSHSSLDCLRP